MVNVVYIDLSAKVEQWSLRSAIAVSNDRYWVYLVPGNVKQLIKQEFTQLHGTKNLQFRVLAFLVYLSVRKNLVRLEVSSVLRGDSF